jgi:hypothetical protein
MQQVCILCNEELPERDTAQGLARQLCQVCIRVVSEQMIVREVKQHLKTVRVEM